jgi:hypothetical protein
MSTSSNLKEKLITAPAAPAVNAGGGFNPPRPGASNSSHIANAATGNLFPYCYFIRCILFCQDYVTMSIEYRL